MFKFGLNKTITKLMWMGLWKPGMSAQDTHVQKKVLFLVCAHDNHVL